jgi:hypothetical protein
LLEAGEPLQADRLLDERLRQAKPGESWVPSAVAMRLEALSQAGDPAAQEVLARQVLDPDQPWVRPGDEGWARAKLVLGETALASGQAAAAREAFEAIIAKPSDNGWGRDDAQFGLAKIMLADPGRFLEGRDDLTAMLDRLPENHKLRPRIEQMLGDVNAKLLMHPEPYGNDQIHTIEKGDTIAGIGKRFGVSPDLIMRVNRIDDPRRLTIGRRMKIPDLDLSVVVNKSDNTLTLLNHGSFFRKYRARTGAYDYQTPTGTFHVGRKVEGPTWTNPQTRQRFAAGEEGNELGARWMGFRENDSLGIHEAVDPSTVGTYGSNGCVGLAREDILEVYDLLPAGTTVTIVGQRTADAPPL